ncbi:MAG: hypothetical protein GF334_12445, partial [Candidatus Altiarchaeales archaeon]|nr:hypothetical protein [Candidatus Altiarchaeales archaeon]
MYDCKTRLDRLLCLREHYWIWRMNGMPHAEARKRAIRSTMGWMRANQSRDRVDAAFRELVATLAGPATLFARTVRDAVMSSANARPSGTPAATTCCVAAHGKDHMTTDEESLDW